VAGFSDKALQVNSRECETYLTARGFQISGRYTPYPSNHSLATRSAAINVHSHNVGPSTYVNLPSSYECYNGLLAPGITRAGYPTYGLSYEDEAYNGQSPAYMLPNNDSIPPTGSIFGPPGSPRNWDVFSGTGRSQTSLYTDHTSTASVSLPSGSFSAGAVPFTSVSADLPSNVASSNPLTTSMTSPDRILPNPTIGRAQQPALLVGANSLDGLAMTTMGYRNSILWSAGDGITGASQSSDRTMSLSYGSTADTSAGSGASSATSASFAYIPISQGSPGTAAKAIECGNAEDVGRASDSAAQDRQRSLSQQDTPSPENNTAESYGYAGDVFAGRRSTRGSIFSGTLTNGQEYTRLRPLPTPNPEIYRSSHQERADYQEEIVRRTSIASLSNNSRY
jgi:hypothetical protein